MTDANQATRVSNATNKRAIRATVIGLRKRKGDVPHPKDLEEGKPEPGQSKALAEDPFEALTAEGRLIEPPFDMLTMAMLPEHSSELGQCIEAYEVNIEGFGYRFVPRIRSDVDLTKVDPVIMAAMRREKTRLENFFAYCSGRLSWVETRRRVRNDLETTGNGYIEVVRNAAGQIQSLNHLPSYQMRLGGQDQEPVKVALPIHELQEDGSIKIVRVPSWERFRRFAQSRSLLLRHATHVGRYTIRWFKEFGDPRVYDYETGEELKGEDIAKVPPENRANEVIHFKLYSPRSPYGLPRTVGNLLSIFGARAAEEINYVTFRNNNIPSMLVLVSNGQLTEGSIERLESFVESQIVGSDNYSKFLLVEAEALGEEGEDTGHVKIEVEKLVDQQHKDALFQNYSGNADSRIRRAFRLPPILVGRADDYTRATADTSRRLADEQIFAPERANHDDMINRLLFPDMGIVYHKYKSNSPNTTDNAELVKILGGAEKTGGMTPRIARLMLEDILGQDLPGFPTEFADKADLPFSLLMAEAVQNKADPTEPGQQVTAVKALDFIEKLTGGDLGEDDEAELAKTAVAINRHFEKRWRREVKDALAG